MIARPDAMDPRIWSIHCRRLRTGLGDRALFLLIGQDAANQLHRWHQWERLFELAHIVILTRPGAPARYPPELAGRFNPAQCPRCRNCLNPGPVPYFTSRLSRLMSRHQVSSISSAQEARRVDAAGGGARVYQQKPPVFSFLTED